MVYVTVYRHIDSSDEEWEAGLRAVEEAVREYAGPVVSSVPACHPWFFAAIFPAYLVIGGAEKLTDLSALQEALDEAWETHRVLSIAEVGHRTPDSVLVGELA